MWVPPCTQVTDKLASHSGKGCVSPTLPYQDLRCQAQVWAGLILLGPKEWTGVSSVTPSSRWFLRGQKRRLLSGPGNSLQVAGACFKLQEPGGRHKQALKCNQLCRVVWAYRNAGVLPELTTTLSQLLLPAGRTYPEKES